MFSYSYKRFLHSVPVLILASFIIFSLINLAGDPLKEERRNHKISDADIERLEQRLGLDQPLYLRYANWLKDFTLGDWGTSFSSGERVSKLVVSRLPATIQLMLLAFLFSAIIGVALGIRSALSPGSLFDNSSATLSYIGFAMPVFWLALILQMALGYYLREWTGIRFFYIAGMYSEGMEWNILNRLQHLVLPVLTLTVVQVAQWSRYQRSSLLEVLKMDYIKAAKAKGLANALVIRRHALRNALIPVITVMAMDLSALFSGAVIVETVFAWPGMGRLFYNAILGWDYPVIMAVLVVSAVLVILFNLLADLAYGWLDPRVRYE